MEKTIIGISENLIPLASRRLALERTDSTGFPYCVAEYRAVLSREDSKFRFYKKYKNAVREFEKARIRMFSHI